VANLSDLRSYVSFQETFSKRFCGLFMQWQEIRQRYPSQWLLVEAIAAHSESGERFLDTIGVVDCFDNSKEALKRYRELHAVVPERELYVLHTSRAEPHIEEQHWLGIRTAE
jgi:hypothetical protein